MKKIPTKSPLTNAQLAELAYGLLEKRVWGSSEVEEVKIAFNLVLMFLTPSERGNLYSQKPTFFYEEMQYAQPKTVNNLPVFATCKYLTQEEFKRFLPIFERIKNHESR